MFSTWNPAEKPSEPKKWRDASFRFLFFNHQDYKDCLVNNIKISKEINLFSSRLQRTYIMQESSRPGTTKPHLERMDQHPSDWAFSVEDINKMTEIRRFFRNSFSNFPLNHLQHITFITSPVGMWNLEPRRQRWPRKSLEVTGLAGRSMGNPRYTLSRMCNLWVAAERGCGVWAFLPVRDAIVDRRLVVWKL